MKMRARSSLVDLNLLAALMLVVTVCGFTSKAGAVTLVAWDSSGVAQNSFPYASGPSAVGILSSSITRGAGLGNAGGTPPANVIGPASGWSETSLANAVAGGDYFEFFVSTAPGFLMSLQTLDAILRSTAAGPTSAAFQFSLNGFATAGTDVGSAFTPSTGNDGGAISQINLAALTALQNLSGTVTFRLYGWGGGTATNNTMGIGRLAGNDLAIGGTITAVPEPTRVMMLGLGLGVLLVGRRRRVK